MVIYEYSSNGLQIGFSFFLLIFAILSVVGMVFFWPLLKTTIGSIIDFTRGKYDLEQPFKEVVAQFVFVTVFTILLYGIFILGMVFGIKTSIDSYRACVNTTDPDYVTGEIQSLKSQKIEHRGELLGYAVNITLNEEEYHIELPPGLDAEALELLKHSTEAKIYYQVEDGANIIVKIEIPI